MNNKQYIMHGMYIKIVEAQPARMYNIYENIKLKLLKTKVAIWYNKWCKAKQLTPKYIHGNITQNEKKQ